MKLKGFLELSKEAVSEWSAENASRLSAALAYYTIFSIAPLLVIILGIVGLIFGQEAARGQVMGQMTGILGQQGAAAMESIAENAQQPASGIIATVISFIVLVFGASGVFYELQTSLNTIWDVERKTGGGILNIIKTRLLSFSIIPVIGFLLVVSLAVSAGISAFGQFLGGFFPGAGILLQILNFVISFAIITILFGLIYKILPDVEIRWRDVWVGAAVTSLLFTIGKLGIGLYLGKSAVASAYGAAGSLIVLLAWVYYSAQIFFFGAEFTQVYANKFGSRIVPSEEAQAMPREEPSAEKYPSRAKGKGAPEPHGTPAEAPVAAGPGEHGTSSRVVPSYRRPLPAAMDEPGEERIRHAWSVAVAGFIGGILAGIFLSRPTKPA